MRLFINRTDLLFIFNETKGIGEYTKNALDFVVNLTNFINDGENGDMRYKTPNDLQNALCNFNREGTLSHTEKMTYDTLCILSPNYKWRLYEALYDYIDKFLW